MHLQIKTIDKHLGVKVETNIEKPSKQNKMNNQNSKSKRQLYEIRRHK